jgi:hypothetical protein
LFDISSIYNLFAIFSVETLIIAQGNIMGYGAVALSGRDNMHRLSNVQKYRANLLKLFFEHYLTNNLQSKGTSPW